MEKKKLLITTDSFLPRLDGVSIFIREILPYLKQKYEITIIAPDFKDERDNENKDNENKDNENKDNENKKEEETNETKESNEIKIIRMPLTKKITLRITGSSDMPFSKPNKKTAKK